jgi:D-amino-acid oxidase
VKAVRVGLRPARPAVRLETEGTPGGVIVHCYGHGGAGVTLSWGCAEEVADVVARLLDRPNVARARQSGVAQ